MMATCITRGICETSKGFCGEGCGFISWPKTKGYEGEAQGQTAFVNDEDHPRRNNKEPRKLFRSTPFISFISVYSCLLIILNYFMKRNSSTRHSVTVTEGNIHNNIHASLWRVERSMGFCPRIVKG